MRLWGMSLLCTGVAAWGIVSSAHAQVPGSNDRVTSAAPEQASREASAQEAAQKEPLAESIIAREEMQSGRAFDPAFRARAKQLLASLSVSALEAQQSREGIGTNALVDTVEDLVYTPVTPCRIIDTRVAGGALTPGVPRPFKVTGDTTVQGGANCGIPFGPATSAIINFVAVSPTGKGNMQITPFGQAMPLASFINYSNTAGTALANGLAVALCNPSGATCTNDVTIQANVSSVDLVADVQGYFIQGAEQTCTGIFTTGLVLNSTCQNLTSCSLTNPSARARTVSCNAVATPSVNHVNGVHNEIAFNVATASNSCAGFAVAGIGYVDVNAAVPTGCCWNPSTSALGTFPLAAGATQTYYFNVQQVLGTGDSVVSSYLRCTLLN